MDKSWMCKSRLNQEYEDGVEQFLNFAFANSSEDDRIICPCIKCVNIHWQTREIVLEHLVCDGILQGYTCWFFHGECVPSPTRRTTNTFTAPSSSNIDIQTSHIRPDSMEELLWDAFNIHQLGNEGPPSTTDEFNVEVNDGDEAPREVDEQPSKEAAKFYKLLEDMNDKLYEGSQHSRLYFCIRLFHLKCMCGMTAKGLDHLIEFLKEFFPSAAIPENSRESKKVIKDLGLGYEKIHSCPNDCMLYWEHNEGQQSCHMCGRSRWVSTDSDRRLNDDNEVFHKRPAKVLRYFPLIPRLQRIFMSAKTSADMIWHANGRTNDGKLRHPADAEAWKSFDARYPDFASDPRNVRLGLSSDGFNPFKLLSTSYSTWPVVMIPYNLPPWIGMKQTSFLLSMIIPGDKGPGDDIDIYLQPLIKELKQLWVGVETYDASARRNFNMRAALLWTINDFPAYANLSGWSTKGKYACPCCAAETSSLWLTNGQKFCYMAHRRWLEHNHPYRSQKHLFDGNIEMRGSPSVTSGSDILLMLEELQFTYGKQAKNKLKKSNTNNKSKKRTRQGSNVDLDTDDDEVQKEELNEAALWKKRSIFFDLPYWRQNLLRHNLDVMHIEKNVCENIVGTILNVDGKSKDNLKCRLDLVEMGIRRELHPQYLPNGKTKLPPASFSMTKKEKDLFCQVLKTIKVPDAYSSNISKCVNQKERKLQSLKSHDYHILLHDLLPIALRSSMSKQVILAISELCNIFKIICGKVLKVEDLDNLQYRAAMALCHLEKIFPPSFFTVMVHLVVHLPLEAKIGGPVYYRWMYPIERFLLKLKSYVRNKRYPEGSIAEGFLAEECVTFCSRYLVDVETIFDRHGRNLTQVHHDLLPNLYLFQSGGEPIGKVEVTELDDKSWAQAHRYVLFHYEAIESLQVEYRNILKDQTRGRRSNARDVDRKFTETFHEWLGETVSNGKNVSEEIKFLAQGPNRIVKRYKGLVINGFRFHTKSRERFRRTQNSGCLVTSATMSYASARDVNPLEGNVDYYGVLNDIIELDYFNKFKVVLFRCDWADVNNGRGLKKDRYGFTMVNFSRTIHTGKHILDEPYVFSSQVKQVFYSEDPKEPDWFVVIRNQPREVYDMGDEITDEGPRTECFPSSFESNFNDNSDGQWAREDVDEDIYDV